MGACCRSDLVREGINPSLLRDPLNPGLHIIIFTLREKENEEKEILIEKKKKPYEKPELVVHGSVEKITEQSLINREGFKNSAGSVGV